MTDMTSSLTERHREVGRRRIAAGEARTAVIRRRYDAPIQDLWDACTDPARLNRWFPKVSGDLRVGGTFSLAGNASGEILRCEPPRRWLTPAYPPAAPARPLRPYPAGPRNPRAKTTIDSATSTTAAISHPTPLVCRWCGSGGGSPVGRRRPRARNIPLVVGGTVEFSVRVA